MPEVTDSTTGKVLEDAMETVEVDALASIRAAMKDPNVSVKIVHTFTHGKAAQVYIKTRKIGPFIISTGEQTLGDVFKMLGDMAVES